MYYVLASGEGLMYGLPTHTTIIVSTTHFLLYIYIYYYVFIIYYFCIALCCDGPQPAQQVED